MTPKMWFVHEKIKTDLHPQLRCSCTQPANTDGASVCWGTCRLSSPPNPPRRLLLCLSSPPTWFVF